MGRGRENKEARKAGKETGKRGKNSGRVGVPPAGTTRIELRMDADEEWIGNIVIGILDS
jgi:hypothetical protein